MSNPGITDTYTLVSKATARSPTDGSQEGKVVVEEQKSTAPHMLTQSAEEKDHADGGATGKLSKLVGT